MSRIVNNFKISVLENRIPYQVKISKTNKLTIKINQDNHVIITIPARVRKDEVEKFIEKNLDWIYEKTANKLTITKRNFKTKEIYYYLGYEYQIYPFIAKTKNDERVDFDQSSRSIKIYAYTQTPENYQKLLNNWRCETATMVFNELLYKVFQRMEKYLKKYPELIIKKYKSRWGTCYYGKNQISLNVTLIHTNIECIEYAICHELSHFVYHNHSKEFHNFVNLFVNEKKCLEMLRKFSPNYE